MLSISLGDVRDFWVVVAGVMWIILGLLLLAIVGAVLYLGRKGMAAVHRLLNKRGVPALQRVQQLANMVAERTGKLPGAPGSEAGVGELVATASELRTMEPPFHRKVKSWRPF